ncbi:DUF4262 domain-containing protein [Lentzea sp. NPDC092896]|uniref:DUF4262 domain-containing protein n=1 Tax=Lentzea sp. NPDC092896 TaxID=3364127 RepID=UPI003818CD46
MSIEVIRRTMDTIDRCGWAIIVHPDENGLLHGYTVGLTFFRVPELHASGLRPEKLHEMLDALARQQSTLGAFTAGQISTAVGVDVRLDPRTDLQCMNLVLALFGDNNPVPPTALDVSVLKEAT